MPFRNSSDHTYNVTTQLRDARLAHGYSWAAMASMIESEYDYPITEDQFRTIEQGLTKRVPLDVVIYAARILGLSPDDVLGDVLS